ncbi:MAG: hypothetical protein JWR08_1826 [Enterovirga sp.]|nr:hypothetical protein [Enterovirga sp.]
MPTLDATPLDTDQDGCENLTYILNSISWTLDAHSVSPSRGSFKLVKNPSLQYDSANGFNTMLSSKAVIDASIITSMSVAECPR